MISPSLKQWLQTPEAIRWWGNPEHEYSLLEEDLYNPNMTMRIVSYLGKPFAYAQDYEVHTWPQPHFEHLPPGSRAIDAFIGDPQLLGTGHGSAFLRPPRPPSKKRRLSVVAIDPDADNLRARRAYEKADFRGDTVVETEAGPAVLMIFEG